jgi:hypothetical protein
MDSEVRPMFPEFFDGLRQNIGGNQRRRTKRQNLAALRRGSPKAGYCGVKLVQTTLRDRKQFAAVARQRHVPTRPVEKPESELLL